MSIFYLFTLHLPFILSKEKQMSKDVLILCTGNSCRSIIAEALINAKLKGVQAHSSGVKASGRVNPHAKALLEQKGIWQEHYHSKRLESVIQNPYDLVVTVCNHAKETCPLFPNATPTIHVGFEDPDGKGAEAFEATYLAIETTLLPAIQEKLKALDESKQTTQKNVFQTQKGVKIAFSGAVKKNNILQMVENCATGACACMSDETKAKIANMEVVGEDGEVELNLTGEISKEEIEQALKNSTVID